MSVKFDKFDELFFDIVLSNTTMFKDTMTKSLEYKLDITKDIVALKTHDINVEYKGKTTKHFIILFGLYHKKDKQFMWISNYNDVFKELLDKYDVERMFGSRRTLDKIFKHEYEISEKYHIAIPYFLAIINPAYNLVSFATSDDDVYFYAFVNLGIKDNFDMKKFVDEMSRYKKAVETDVVPKNLSRNLMKKTKKKTSKKIKK